MSLISALFTYFSSSGVDPLHHWIYSLLRGGDCCRYWVYYSSHLLQYGTPCFINRQETKSRDCNDHVKADAFPVSLASQLFCNFLKYSERSYQGHIGAALVLGGVDSTGPHLFTIHPHGSTDKLPYVTMGSGSLAAMAVFESGWRPNLEVIDANEHISKEGWILFSQRQEALALVTSAISAGIFNDLGSGSNIDACVITASHTEMLRNFVKPNEREQKERTYGFRRGTTAWKSETIRSLICSEEVSSIGAEAMDTTWYHRVEISWPTHQITVFLKKKWLVCTLDLVI